MKKGIHVYDWDSEPADERPSEFQRSTGYGPLSGYHSTYHSTLDPEVQARHHRRYQSGGLKLLLILAAIVGAGAFAMYRFARIVHG